MVKALFDTNVLIDYLNGIEASRKEFALYSDRAISIVSWMEVLIGAQGNDEAAIRAFLGGFSLIQLDHSIAENAVRLRQDYRLKLPDAIIWASAQCQGRLLVTRNIRDFPADHPSVRIPYKI